MSVSRWWFDPEIHRSPGMHRGPDHRTGDFPGLALRPKDRGELARHLLPVPVPVDPDGDRPVLPPLAVAAVAPSEAEQGGVHRHDILLIALVAVDPDPLLLRHRRQAVEGGTPGAHVGQP